MGALTDQQLNFFGAFGFLGFPGLLVSEIADLTNAFEQVFRDRGGGHNGQAHDGQKRSCIVPFIDQSPRLSALLDDPRIHDILTSLLGDDFNYMGSDGNYYTGDTSWHSDGWHSNHVHVKIAFYLDELTRETGALRVIPGSHRVGEPYADQLQKELPRSQELWGIGGRDVPALALETRPGDAVVFNHNTKHASFGGGKARRMFTINCAQRYPAARLQELRDYIAGHARFWIDRAYGPAMLAGASGQRMVHLEQVMANDGHLAELSRQARARTLEPARG
jgi:hypothetical protein